MKIPRALYDEIVEHAVADAPNECCGIVSADDGGEAVKVYRAENKLANRFSFSVDEQDLFRIYNEIEDAGLDLRAIYHSHTRSAPKPSLTDIRYADGWPGVLWIIVGLAGPEPEVRTWLIDGGDVREAELVVE
ncbi:MAG TPA: M67 family metallopeptidase [Solirubrobacteraceae bacterium]|jgi:[CysO sulfur-carrier protein]-S-L-cysteine hydrolase|nr:M67 family metallopeptidase [Solirubrobacteraceae bacterium]